MLKCPELQTTFLNFLRSLRAALEEGQKTSNVDIQFMLASIHKCQGVVQQLTDKEVDPFDRVGDKQFLQNINVPDRPYGYSDRMCTVLISTNKSQEKKSMILY